nr:MAG TPA: hypothetical protein [Caudoviricetes sp.]
MYKVLYLRQAIEIQQQRLFSCECSSVCIWNTYQKKVLKSLKKRC